MDVATQIRAGKLRCVKSGETLALQNGELAGGHHRYPLAGAVPILMKDDSAVHALLTDNPDMEHEYRAPSLYQRLRARLYKDYHARAFRDLLERFLRQGAPDAVLLSVGGGPGRIGAHTTNLNIGPFPNVDIVGDAHDLPYHDASVDAVHCDAVLEHVQDPFTVVREIRRVLKPGGQVLSIVPFLQGYHGYPSHFQNFTLSGHEHLYRSNGFKVISSGACHGPFVALTTLNARLFLEYFPPGLNIVFGRAAQALGLLLRPLDRLLENHPRRHMLASTTYVLAEKIR